jgi:hypothetical protein
MGPLVLDECPGQRAFLLSGFDLGLSVHCGLDEDRQGVEGENKEWIMVGL